MFKTLQFNIDFNKYSVDSMNTLLSPEPVITFCQVKAQWDQNEKKITYYF